MSPKSLFFGLVIVGLPFAVVAGWALGAPAINAAALGLSGEPDGVGGLGAAPAPTSSTPVGGYTARPPRATSLPATSTPPASAPSAAPAVTMTVTVVTSVPPPLVSASLPPLLTDPPVPTPTQITEDPDPSDAPPPPSETPAASLTPSPSGS
ncbi:hypothetical protein [Actinoplanes sp. OR16]|uniref:hypothetical protein n=1 Tax=Actinoplanes sp. OR16 TaxID=946334 RepID=UPI000FDB2BD7|nr:hypothetical protein [Actinoplanes sp. OR16]